MIVSVFLFAISFFGLVESYSIFSSNELDKRQLMTEEVFNGSPGFMCYADNYNILGNNWNHTYTMSEPQQIHISLTDDATHARVQFATLGEIDDSVLTYWPKKENRNHNRGHRASKNKITIKGEVIVFYSYSERNKKLFCLCYLFIYSTV